MKVLLALVMAGTVVAFPTNDWPPKQAISVGCGTVFDLNDYEEADVEFSSEIGLTGDCRVKIRAPEGYHVEVACSGGDVRANGKNATDFYGKAPVEINFNLEDEMSQVFCRVELVEEYEDMKKLHGENGVETNIEEFEAAFNIHEKDEKTRSAILAANEKLIISINAENTGNTESGNWTAGVTSMSDKTVEEMQQQYTGLPPLPSEEDRNIASDRAERELLEPMRQNRGALPAFVDLTTLGRVSTAKNQHQCGSCAAFAAASTIESCMHKVTGVLPTDISEQHLMDCAWPASDQGHNICRAAWPKRYHEWMHTTNNGGIADERDYPYAHGGGTIDKTTATQCDPTVRNINHGAVVTSHQQSWRATEDDIMMLLAAGNAVTTSFRATGGFGSYRTGIYTEPECTNHRDPGKHEWINHAVVIVGYGEEGGVKYWKFKNSWGSGWGDNGFGKIIRGGGHCGFAMEFSVPFCSASSEPVPTEGPATTPAPSPVKSCKNQKLYTDLGVAPVSLSSPNSKVKTRQDGTITDWGYKSCGAGWFDVQGQGVENDYCRWVGNCGCRGECSFWSCALAGSEEQYTAKGKYSEPDSFSLDGGLWGDWGPREMCSYPNFVTKMEVKIEAPDGDDTALNAIRLTCSDGKTIVSSAGEWGTWRGVQPCPSGSYIKKAQIRKEAEQGGGDDTAANGVRFECTDGTELHPGDGYWGDWSSWGSCPEGSAVIGMKTQVESNQQGCDDTSLNDVTFYCAQLPPGCPEGQTQFENNCYLLPDGVQKSWTDAQNYCRELSKENPTLKYDLVSLQSEEEYNFILNTEWSEVYTKWKSQFGIWIGLNDRDTEGEFKWSDGSPVDYGKPVGKGTPPWRKGEPYAPPGTDEDCVRTYGLEGWTDRKCSAEISFICEGKPVKESCDWTISVPEGQTVNLMFDEFDMEPGYDEVTVYNGEGTDSPPQWIFQGPNKPEPIWSDGNKMTVVFTSASENIETRGTFKASASASDSK